MFGELLTYGDPMDPMVILSETHLPPEDLPDVGGVTMAAFSISSSSSLLLSSSSAKRLAASFVGLEISASSRSSSLPDFGCIPCNICLYASVSETEYVVQG